jgi:hypothetical protein
VNAREVEPVERSQQRLARQKPDCGRHLAEIVDPAQHTGVLDRHAHPQIRRPLQVEAEQSPGSLGQHLVGVLGGVLHHLEDLADEGDRDAGVE